MNVMTLRMMTIALVCLHGQVAVAALPEAVIGEARQLCAGGDVRNGVDRLLDAGIADEENNSAALRLDASMALADCYLYTGSTPEARRALRQGSAIARAAGLQDRETSILQALVGLHLDAGQFAEAIEALDRLSEVIPDGDPSALAAAINNRGIAYAGSGRIDEAIAEFERAVELAVRAGDTRLLFDGRVNLARALLERGDQEGVSDLLAMIRNTAGAMSDPDLQTAQSLALGELGVRYGRVSGAAVDFEQASAALKRAAAGARASEDAGTESYALGFLGEVAMHRGELQDALSLTRLAVARASKAQALDGLYRWQWQAGRILEETGKPDLAITAYRQAIDTLESIRPLLARHSTKTYQDAFLPLFYDMANLLIETGTGSSEAGKTAANLRLVQRTLERVKAAEIRDYFDDECVIVEESEAVLDDVSGGAAIVYPIVFPDRLEVLVSTGGHIELYTSQVSRGELTETVRRFRRRLERRPSHRYRLEGRKLYDWVIAGAVEDLREAGVSTLVFVPDGPLRTIPPAALYDGSRFLIEEFAIVSTLGMTLTSPQPIARTDLRVLASGITDSVQGFGSLPAVGQELDNIRELFTTTEYRNDAFRLEPVSEELSEGRYSIVHIATHGQFKSDHRESFLLTYDDRLTLDMLQDTVGLRRYLNEPIELLMLSACETAIGDDRAALGLAGVAIKAGARSAVATLWAINDDATADLVTGFYRRLSRSAQISKAEALRQAQLELIRDQRYAHPAVWSPFLLLGNWL